MNPIASIENLKISARNAAVAAGMVLAAGVMAAAPGNAEAASYQKDKRAECMQAGGNIERATGNYARQAHRETAALSNLLIAVAAPVVKNVVCDMATEEKPAENKNSPASAVKNFFR